MLQYNKLEPQRKEIRLLSLLPGKANYPIECTLQTISLESPPDFEALSYVWGEPSIKKPLIVNGVPHSVTLNLEAALRAFRNHQTVRVLWVDALCINQNDLHEKNVQVPQMARLYLAASAVLVWLGPSTPSIELAISWAQTYVTKEYTNASTYWLTLDANSASSDRAKLEKHWAILRALEGYFDILALPYWNRMWTFQEFRLPRNEPLCYCGSMSFRLVTILGAAEDRIHTAGFDALRILSKPPYLDPSWNWAALSQEQEQFVERLFMAQKITQEKSTASRKNMSILPSIARQPWQGKDSALIYLLITTTERQGFDMRDKIFALYGMVPVAREVYPPDYSKPVREVMLETAAFLITYERGPVMWSSFGLREDRLSDTTYPSWEPDFTQADQAAPNMHRAINVKNGSRMAPSLRRWEKPPPARVSHDLKTVNLWARSMGTCNIVFNFESQTSKVLQQIEGCLRTTVSSLTNSSLGKKIRNPENLQTRLASAFVIHYVGSERFTLEEIIETFDAIFKNDRSKKGSCWKMIHHAAESLVDKSFLVIEGGCFGIGVSGMKDGDVMTLPPQVTLPLVLTKETPTSPDEGEFYRMVGTAWVDGIIEGQFLDPDLVAELEHEALKEFSIH